jgi:polyhydroxyalkanoate synthesis regulator phasin
MEKYYKVSDINEILNKLVKEPAYYHEGEGFYNGVCAVGGELMCLEPVEADIDELKKEVADLNNRRHLIWAIGVDYDGCNTVESLKELIDELVSYTQLPREQVPDITSRTGRWVRKEHVINEYGDTESSFVCSCCDKKYKRGEYTPKRFVEEHKFCPNCGAKMKE